VQPFAVQPFNVQPFAVQPFGVVPFSAQPNAQAEAQAFGNWLALVRQGCQIIGGGGGQGGGAQDFNKLNSSIQGLKSEIAELRKTNEKILGELTQIRKGDKSDPPAPKAQGGAGIGADKPDENSQKAKPATGPTYVAVDKQLNDLATSRKLIDAQRAAAKAKTPLAPSTSVAGNR
jgi:hypothetical protein